jgi:hypothetical protein
MNEQPTKSTWTVQRWSQYKNSRAPFSHDSWVDKNFDSEEEAQKYSLEANSGIGGDTRYRYLVVQIN